MTNEQIEEYSKYIYGIAKKFNNYPSKEDLYQAGYMGLIEAYKNYNPKIETKFTTYAYPYIFGEMCKLIREDKNIKVGRSVIKLKSQIDKVTILLSQRYLREPTSKEIASFLEIGEEEVDYIKQIKETISIDKPILEDGKEINMHDMLPNKELDIDTLIALKEEINNLDDEEKKILLYSLDMNQTEVGKIVNMNQVKVSRSLAKIKTKIKDKVA